jgi:hypothetical protein
MCASLRREDIQAMILGNMNIMDPVGWCVVMVGADLTDCN